MMNFGASHDELFTIKGVHAVSQVVSSMAYLSMQLANGNAIGALTGWARKCNKQLRDSSVWHQTHVGTYTSLNLAHVHAHVCIFALIADIHVGMQMLHGATHLLAPALNSTSMIRSIVDITP